MNERILLVDDSAFMRLIEKNILVKNGYVICEEAADGLEAFEKNKELKPDIVILDITMPNKDGLADLKLIKTDYPDAKIIVCSARNRKDFITASIKLGALDYIIKPFQTEKLIKTVGYFFNQANDLKKA